MRLLKYCSNHKLQNITSLLLLLLLLFFPFLRGRSSVPIPIVKIELCDQNKDLFSNSKSGYGSISHISLKFKGF